MSILVYVYIFSKAKLGEKIAAAGYFLSIPAAVERTDSFQKLVRSIPMDFILTETGDSFLSVLCIADVIPYFRLSLHGT